MNILAIETSCDDTAVAIVRCKNDFKNLQTKVLASEISSQIKIHAKHGGIVPNLAAREHEKNLAVIFKQALKKAKIKQKDFEKEIALIAVTKGPGLQPALLMGLNFAKALAYFTNKPLIGVNHLEGHIFSCLIDFEKEKNNDINLPAVCLLVSGGHTQLYEIKSWDDISLKGETLDDAAGECFDKIAKMLKLGYPGGVFVSKMADQFILKNKNYKKQFNLPRPLIGSKDFDFSFSGLKTAVLYLIQKLKKEKSFTQKTKSQICFEAQEAICEVLVKKTLNLAEKSKAKTIIISGGVSANKRLRTLFEEKIKNDYAFFAPDLKMTTDNAAMIAVAGYYQWLKNKKDDPLSLEVDLTL